MHHTNHPPPTHHQQLVCDRTVMGEVVKSLYGFKKNICQDWWSNLYMVFNMIYDGS